MAPIKELRHDYSNPMSEEEIEALAQKFRELRKRRGEKNPIDDVPEGETANDEFTERRGAKGVDPPKGDQ